jgi:hypothetical protein
MHTRRVPAPIPPVCQQVPDEAGVHDIIQELSQQGQVLLGAQLARIMLVKVLSSRQGCTAQTQHGTVSMSACCQLADGSVAVLHCNLKHLQQAECPAVDTAHLLVLPSPPVPAT